MTERLELGERRMHAGVSMACLVRSGDALVV